MRINVKSGFTLIELMIVISIIGILSMVIVPKVVPLKNQAKINQVQSNVYLVRSYLENRAGADKSNIAFNLPQGASTSTIASFLTNLIQNSIVPDMNAKFSGSNAFKNPFNNNTAINCGTSLQSAGPGSSAVSISFNTGTLPTDVSTINNNMPDVTGYPGLVAVIVYQTGYVIYGIDNTGNKVQPTIQPMPVNALSANFTPIVNPTINPTPTTPQAQALSGNINAVVAFLKQKVSIDILDFNGNMSNTTTNAYNELATYFNSALNWYTFNFAYTNPLYNTVDNSTGVYPAQSNYYDSGNSIVVYQDGVLSANTISQYKGCVMVDVTSSPLGYKVYGVDENGNIYGTVTLVSTIDNIKPSLDANVKTVANYMKSNWSKFGSSGFSTNVYNNLNYNLEGKVVNPLFQSWSSVGWANSYYTDLVSVGYSWWGWYLIAQQNQTDSIICTTSDRSNNLFTNYRGAVIVNFPPTSSGIYAQVYGYYSDGTRTTIYNLDKYGNISPAFNY